MCTRLDLMERLTISRPMAVLAALCVVVSGCGAGLNPCETANWVDQVADRWVVLSAPDGSLQTLAREPDRPHWREGDAIVDGRVNQVCAKQLLDEIRSAREALVK